MEDIKEQFIHDLNCVKYCLTNIPDSPSIHELMGRVLESYYSYINARIKQNAPQINQGDV